VGKHAQEDDGVREGAAWAWQHGLDLQVEAIAQRDADSQWALADAQELYASVEARASAVIKQEDLAVRARQVNQRVREVEELEGLLQEWEELDDITLRRELEALSTRDTSLDRLEVDLEWERKALEDVRDQILAHELDADARETELRDQEARLAAREWQLAERQIQELVVAQKGLEDPRPLELATDSVFGASWARQTLLCRPLASALAGEGTRHLKPASYFPFLTRPGGMPHSSTGGG
jgi:hypothetical protein